MIQAHSKVEEESYDLEMQLIAWQTALLMNATGNFKKKIKPSDLYTPLEDDEELAGEVKSDQVSKEQLQKELMDSFAGSNVIIK